MSKVASYTNTVLYKKSPESWDLVLSPSAINKDANGNPSATSVKCTVVKYVGSEATTPTSGFSLYYVRNGGSETSMSTKGSVSVSSSTTSLDFVLKVDGVEIKRSSVTFTSDGKNGKDGNDGQDGSSVHPNILRNTAFVSNFTRWSFNSGSNKVAYNGGVGGYNYMRITFVNESSYPYANLWWQTLANGDKPIERGKTYTFSAYVRGTASYWYYSCYYSSGTSPQKFFRRSESAYDTTNWTKVTYTFTARTDADPTRVGMLRIYGSVGNYLELCQLKLEEGDTATDYDYAPSDKIIIPRQRGEWAANSYYCSGKPCEEYLDLVLNGNLYYMCKTAHTSGTSFDETYWDRAANFDFVATRVISLNYALGTDAQGNVNVLIDGNTGTLKANKAELQGCTIGSSGGNSRVEIADGLINFYGRLSFPNITLGIDDNGCAVLKFYDKNGNFKYDLGPESIVGQLSSRKSYFIGISRLGKTTITSSTSYSRGLIEGFSSIDDIPYYRFMEGYSALNNTINKYLISGTSTPSSYNGQVYNANTLSSSADSAIPSGTKIAAGYYIGKEFPVQHDTLTIMRREFYNVASAGATPTVIGCFIYRTEYEAHRCYPCNAKGEDYESLAGMTMVNVAMMMYNDINNQ